MPGGFTGGSDHVQITAWRQGIASEIIAPVNISTQPDQDPHRVGIDAASLVLAGIAAAAILITGPGDWDVVALVIGLVLVLVTVGYHHPVRLDRTPRSVVLRCGFGAITALAACVCIAWPLQRLIMEPLVHPLNPDGSSAAAYFTTEVLMAVWFPIAAALAYYEPKIARWLDKPRARRREARRAGDRGR